MNHSENVTSPAASSFFRDNRGATMIEYIVIVSLILLVAIGAWKQLGSNVNTKVNAAANELK
ncbi:MAG: Flp family type IVb pilin [Polyangiaceae bacterium]